MSTGMIKDMTEGIEVDLEVMTEIIGEDKKTSETEVETGMREIIVTDKQIEKEAENEVILEDKMMTHQHQIIKERVEVLILHISPVMKVCPVVKSKCRFKTKITQINN